MFSVTEYIIRLLYIKEKTVKSIKNDLKYIFFVAGVLSGERLKFIS